MALSRTTLTSTVSADGHGTGPLTSSSFTPPDNSLIVVVGGGMATAGVADPSANLTMAGGSLTFTRRVFTGVGTDFGIGVAIWTAPVTTGASMTLTLDCGATNLQIGAISAVAYTGYDTANPVGGSGTGSQGAGASDGAQSQNLNATPAIDSEVIAAIMLDKESAGCTPGAAYAEIHDLQIGATGGLETEVRGNSTSTTFDWVDTHTGTGSIFKIAYVGLEIKAGADAPTTTVLQTTWPALTEKLGGRWPRPQAPIFAPADAAPQASAEIGTDGEAFTITATEKKVAVQSGVCVIAPAKVTAANKKVAVSAAVNTAAAAVAAVDKKVAVSRGTAAAAPAKVTAANSKVAVSRGTAAAAFADTAVDTVSSGTPTAAERGTATAAAAITATDKKVAVQTAVCVVAPASLAAARKVAVGRGTSAAAFVDTAVDKKVATERGTSAVATADTAVDKKTAVSRGTSTAAFADTAVESQGIVISAERGQSAAAPTITAADKKVAVQTAVCAVGPVARAQQAKKSAQVATVAFAPGVTGLSSKKVASRGTSAIASDAIAIKIPSVSYGTGNAGSRSAQTGAAANGVSASGRSGQTLSGEAVYPSGSLFPGEGLNPGGDGVVSGRSGSSPFGESQIVPFTIPAVVGSDVVLGRAGSALAGSGRTGRG